MLPSKKKIALIIDDDESFINFYNNILIKSDIDKVTSSTDEHHIMKVLDKGNVKIVIYDVEKTILSGVDMLTAIKLLYPEIPIIILTGENEIKIAVECLKKGAYDFINKNEDRLNIGKIIESALNYNSAMGELEIMRQDISYLTNIKLNIKLKNKDAFSDIITNSKIMFSIFAYCEAVSKTDNTVLIMGETGTGKELIAKTLYKAGNKKGKFVACNIAGFDDQMMSDTLFGHIKGAYTGALSNRKGLVEEAENGTLFLDEIGDLNLSSQVKLLRLLQEKEYIPLGSDNIKTANTQVIVATNHNLKVLTNDKEFRKDLYYRLMTHYIQLPSLKERKGDIPLLLDYFVKTIAEKLKIKIPSYHPSLVGMLQNYGFPGNIRELKNMVEDSLINHNSKMLSNMIFQKHINRNSEELGDDVKFLVEDLVSNLESLPCIKDMTDALVRESLKRAKGNQSQAARMLQISHQALSRRLKNI